MTSMILRTKTFENPSILPLPSTACPQWYAGTGSWQPMVGMFTGQIISLKPAMVGIRHYRNYQQELPTVLTWLGPADFNLHMWPDSNHSSESTTINLVPVTTVSHPAKRHHDFISYLSTFSLALPLLFLYLTTWVNFKSVDKVISVS